ncbi:MAG: type II secretion system inner membrane protein GspF [Deltaproteobacteria bacterium]|jgi:general secretion pathway protein F|nr:type II secretion system inner membrane protein GspF [Deltaproteobacteria bacterium]
MPIYEYKGLNSKGKAAAGVLDADSPRSLRERLVKDGIFLSEYIETRGGAETRRAGQQQAGSREVRFTFLQSVKLLEVAEATRQLATLVRSGIQVTDAIGAIADQLENPLFKKVLSEVKRNVSEGSTLANALKKHPKIFSDLYVNMVASGESSGTLDVVFERLADVSESQVRLRSKLTSALVYPVIMLVMSFGIVLMMMIFVIPKITELLEQMGKELPTATKFLIGVSSIVRDWWWLLILIFGLGFFLFLRWKKTEEGHQTWDRWTLKFPIFGRLFREMGVARFARTLSTLLAAGVPILNALTIVQNVIGNVILGKVVENARDAVKEGQPIAEALKRSREFPPMVVHMISVGEKSGQLEQMLNNVANSYELQAEQKVTRLTAILEPMMIVMMGLVVGFMVVAIVLPMMDMSQLGQR